MNNPEKDKSAGALERIKEIASNVGEALVPSKNQILAVGAATVAAFGASEISQNSQAEARTPVDSANNMVAVETVTLKETVIKKNGDKDTTVQISRKAYNPFEERGVKSDYVPKGIYTAINGSKNLTATKQKDSRFLPLSMAYVLPDAYGCGLPAASKLPFRYNPRDKYRIAGRPSYKKIFGKKRFDVRAKVTTEYSTGMDDKDAEIRQGSPANNPLVKVENLRRLAIKPTNRTTTRKFNINMDQCYPLAQATNPKYDKHKAAGYEFVPPTSLRIEYTGKIKNRKNGVTYVAETEGGFELVDIRIYNPEAYQTAP